MARSVLSFSFFNFSLLFSGVSLCPRRRALIPNRETREGFHPREEHLFLLFPSMAADQSQQVQKPMETIGRRSIGSSNQRRVNQLSPFPDRTASEPARYSKTLSFSLMLNRCLIFLAVLSGGLQFFYWFFLIIVQVR